MELADVVIELRDELQAGHADYQFGAPAWRRLREAITALKTAIGQISAAAVYGRTCGLVTVGFVDDDHKYDEGGCPVHAGAVLTADPDARITKITAAARALLLGTLPRRDRPPPGGTGPART